MVRNGAVHGLGPSIPSVPALAAEDRDMTLFGPEPRFEAYLSWDDRMQTTMQLEIPEATAEDLSGIAHGLLQLAVEFAQRYKVPLRIRMADGQTGTLGAG